MYQRWDSLKSEEMGSGRALDNECALSSILMKHNRLLSPHNLEVADYRTRPPPRKQTFTMKLASIVLIITSIISKVHSNPSNGGNAAVRMLRPDKNLRSKEDGVSKTKVKKAGDAKSSKPNFQDLAPDAKSVKVQNAKSGKVQNTKATKTVDAKSAKAVGLTDSADSKPTPKPSRKKPTPKPSQPEEPIPPKTINPTNSPTPCTKKPTLMPSPIPTCNCGDKTTTPTKSPQAPPALFTPFPTESPTPVPCFDDVQEDFPSSSPTTSNSPTMSNAPSSDCTCEDTLSPTEETNIPPGPTNKPTRKPTRSPQYYFDTLPPTNEFDETSGKPSPAPTVSWMPSVWKASDIIENTPPVGSKAVGSKATTKGSKATGPKTTGGAKATGPKTTGGAKATGPKTTGGAKATGPKTTGGAKATGPKTTGGAKTTGPNTTGNVPPNKTNSNNGGGGGDGGSGNKSNTNGDWNGSKF